MPKPESAPRMMWRVLRCYRRAAPGQAVHQTTGCNRGETRVQALLAQRRRWQGRASRRESGAAGMYTVPGAPARLETRRGDRGPSSTPPRGPLASNLPPAYLLDEHPDEAPDRAVIDAAARAVDHQVIDRQLRNRRVSPGRVAGSRLPRPARDRTSASPWSAARSFSSAWCSPSSAVCPDLSSRRVAAAVAAD